MLALARSAIEALAFSGSPLPTPPTLLLAAAIDSTLVAPRGTYRAKCGRVVHSSNIIIENINNVKIIK